ncbi:MAG: nucleotidyltransferase family protein, partial [Proteobacteria bacterium]
LGRAKQLLELAGEPLVAIAADAAVALCGAGVRVVLGARAGEIAARLAGKRLALVENPRWEEGMGTSLAAGVAALPACDGVLLLLSDQPLVPLRALGEMVERWRADRERVVAAEYGGALGVPAIVPRRLFAALAAVRGDRGARGVIAGEGERVVRVALPEALFDVDDEASAAELARLSRPD